jgi:putative PIN family toxin of toxin-antitoxin system
LLLFVSEYIVQEIRELPQKLKPRLGVTAERVERLIQDLAKYSQRVERIPIVYIHPVDPDDSHYVNLAVETQSALIVTRDRHLLNLTDLKIKASADFKARFPTLTVTTPDFLAEQLRQN